MNKPVASLTVSIFQYAMGPYESWHAQAWAASLVITVSILMITVAGRFLIKRGTEGNERPEGFEVKGLNFYYAGSVHATEKYHPAGL